MWFPVTILLLYIPQTLSQQQNSLSGAAATTILTRNNCSTIVALEPPAPNTVLAFRVLQAPLLRCTITFHGPQNGGDYRLLIQLLELDLNPGPFDCELGAVRLYSLSHGQPTLMRSVCGAENFTSAFLPDDNTAILTYSSDRLAAGTGFTVLVQVIGPPQNQNQYGNSQYHQIANNYLLPTPGQPENVQPPTSVPDNLPPPSVANHSQSSQQYQGDYTTPGGYYVQPGYRPMSTSEAPPVVYQAQGNPYYASYNNYYQPTTSVPEINYQTSVSLTYQPPGFYGNNTLPSGNYFQQLINFFQTSRQDNLPPSTHQSTSSYYQPPMGNAYQKPVPPNSYYQSPGKDEANTPAGKPYYVTVTPVPVISYQSSTTGYYPNSISRKDDGVVSQKDYSITPPSRRYYNVITLPTIRDFYYQNSYQQIGNSYSSTGPSKGYSAPSSYQSTTSSKDYSIPSLYQSTVSPNSYNIPSSYQSTLPSKDYSVPSHTTISPPTVTTPTFYYSNSIKDYSITPPSKLYPDIATHLPYYQPSIGSVTIKPLYQPPSNPYQTAKPYYFPPGSTVTPSVGTGYYQPPYLSTTGYQTITPKPYYGTPTPSSYYKPTTGHDKDCNETQWVPGKLSLGNYWSQQIPQIHTAYHL